MYVYVLILTPSGICVQICYCRGKQHQQRRCFWCSVNQRKFATQTPTSTAAKAKAVPAITTNKACRLAVAKRVSQECETKTKKNVPTATAVPPWRHIRFFFSLCCCCFFFFVSVAFYHITYAILCICLAFICVCQSCRYCMIKKNFMRFYLNFFFTRLFCFAWRSLDCSAWL